MRNQLVGIDRLGVFWCGHFDIRPLLQGQTGIAKLKSAYNTLIIGPRGLGCGIKLGS